MKLLQKVFLEEVIYTYLQKTEWFEQKLFIHMEFIMTLDLYCYKESRELTVYLLLDRIMVLILKKEMDRVGSEI